jgi:hypothetical protein
MVMVLTNFLSNNAAAVLFTPIAINMANQLGHPAEAFVVCLIFAANTFFRDSDRLSDQPDRDGPGPLQVCRLHTGRSAAVGNFVVDLLFGSPMVLQSVADNRSVGKGP